MRDNEYFKIIIILCFVAGCAISPFSSYSFFASLPQFFLLLIATLFSGACIGLMIFALGMFIFGHIFTGFHPKLEMFLIAILVPIIVSLAKFYSAHYFD